MSETFIQQNDKTFTRSVSTVQHLFNFLISFTMKAIPDNVKDILGQLSAPQQVALRRYIASLRSEIKDLESDLKAKNDPDPNAHYHGDVKCTADHSHAEHGHDDDCKEHHSEEHGQRHAEHKKNDNHHHEHSKDDHKEGKANAHEHGHENKKEDCCDHHDHKEHSNDDHDHKEHSHDHEEHEEHPHKHHKHGHDESGGEKQEEVPEWKKKALASGNNDPTAAPFGGNWISESIVDASSSTVTKMEE